MKWIEIKQLYYQFTIVYFWLISNIETIINKYINIEKFIAELAKNDSKIQCKLLAKSLLSFYFNHCVYNVSSYFK
ncbi:hypothetical protein COM15_21395 [Bacillus wiedmannii]|nr:hypothetical protein CON91_24900 [Bacillus wiedmannii]PGB67307.1 hypothetical protein COM15_21395 [Bacillus wiedmannii]